MREPGRLLWLLPMLAGCSVGNLSFEEALVELDSVADIEEQDGKQRMVYREKAEVLPWYTRFWPTLPLKPVFRTLFDSEPRLTELENPSGHARDLMMVVGEEACGDLLRTTAAVQRLVRVMELDHSALNRIVALEQVVSMSRALGMDLLEGVLDPERQPVARADEPRWVDALRRNRPAARPDGPASALAPDRRQEYLEAIRALTERPLSQPSQRLALVHDLQQSLAQEADAELRDANARALTLALQWCMQQAALQAMQGVDPEYAEVRRAAIAAVHRAAGADSVPILLALVANPPEVVLEGNHRFDPDPYVRLKLIHLCGQLDLERAQVAVRIPGRETGDPTSAVDFLVQEILDPDMLHPGLQTVAIEALSHCLRRPVDYELDWVREWYARNRT